MAEKCRIAKTAARKLLLHCKWGTASQWEPPRLATKLLMVKEILTDETANPKDEDVAETLLKVLAAIDNKKEFEVYDDEAGEVSTAASTPAPVVTPVPAVETPTPESVKEPEKLPELPEPVASPPAKPAQPVTSPQPETPPQPVAETAATDAGKGKGKGRGRKKATPEAESTAPAPAAPADEAGTVVIPEVEAEEVPQSHTTVETVDGATADKIRELFGDKNAFSDAIHNRKFMLGLGKRYRDIRLAGGWDCGLRLHVIVDSNGKVQNANHSLWSLLAAQELVNKKPGDYPHIRRPLTQDLIIERGIQPRSANFIDIGKGRTHGDLIFRMGLIDDKKYKPGQRQTLAKWLGTAGRIYYNRTELGKKVRTADKFEHASLVDILDSNIGLFDSAQFIMDLDNNPEHLKCIRLLKVPHPYLVAIHYFAWMSKITAENKLPSEVERTAADDFVKNLAFGITKGEDDPIYVLREWLLRDKGGRGNEMLNRIYDALVVTWNAVQDGSKITSKQLTGLKAASWFEMGGLDKKPE